MSGKVYSCTRDDWGWIIRDLPDGSKFIEGVVFSDGHRIMFCDMPDRQRLAYLKAGGLKRGPNGELSVAKGEN